VKGAGRLAKDVRQADDVREPASLEGVIPATSADAARADEVKRDSLVR
jgi:hypothetical protein